MRLTRTALALTAAAALTVGMGTPANALPNPGVSDNLFTIHLVIPDPTNALALCSINYTPTSSVNFNIVGIANGTAGEAGRISVTSSGCASVTWTSVAIVKDESPGHPTVSRVATGSTSANVAQTVPYAVGVREAGTVTFELYVSSRLGFFCWEDIWEVTAFGNPSPIKTGPC